MTDHKTPHQNLSSDRPMSFMRRLSQMGTRLHTRFKGQEVGQDVWGNRYYVEKNPKETKLEKRWVLFATDPSCGKIPPLWQLWLNHISDTAPKSAFSVAPLSVTSPLNEAEKNTQTPKESCHVPEHMVRGKGRGRNSRDYLPWRPPHRSSGGSFGRF